MSLRKLIPLFPMVVLFAACSSNTADTTTTTEAQGPTTTSVPTTTTTAATATSTSTSTTLSKADRDAAWREDIATFWDRLPLIHPNPFWRTPEDEFGAIVSDLSARVPDLSDDEIELELIRIVALIDGHTVLSTTSPSLDYQRLGLRLYEFSDGLFVVEATDPGLVGARVVSLNGIPIGDALQRVEPYVHHDNDQNLKNLRPLYLTMPEILEGAGLVAAGKTTTFLVEMTDGEQVEITPSVGEAPPDPYPDYVVNLPGREGLLAGERVEEPFWFTYLEDEAAIYLQYNMVTRRSQDSETGDSKRLTDVVEEMGAIVSSEPVGRIVVDVRRNPGGDNFTFDPLVDFLKEQDAAGIDLVVITGRQTHSAASNFATILDVDTGAVFVGEGMGGRPNLYGDTTGIYLPNSGLSPLVSTRYWEFGGPDDDRATIEPDFPVEMSSSDFFGNVDPELDAALTVALP